MAEPMKKKMTMKELADQIRDNVEIPPGMSDKELVLRVMDARPDLKLGQMLSDSPRSSSEIFSDKNAQNRFPEPQGSAGSRFASGLADPLVQGVQGLISQGFEGAQKTKDARTRGGMIGGFKEQMKQSFVDPIKGVGQVLKHPAESVFPGFKDKVAQGDIAGAAGSATTSAAALLSMLGKGKGAGATESEIQKFTALTDRITTPIRDTLNLQGEAIKGAMTTQLSNVAALRGNPLFRKISAKLANMETAPGTAKMDVTATKNAVEEMANQVNSDKATNWNDLFELNKKLKAAGAAVDDPTTKSMIRKLTDTVGDELKAGAGKAGVGTQYEKWQEQYAKFSDLRRRYDDMLRGKTDIQMETKGSALSTKKQIPGTGIGFGSTKATKVAKTNASMIKQAHKAFEQLHGEIKAAPKIPKPPAAPKAPATPPVVPPAGAAPTSGPAGPVTPGSGTFNRNPRANPVEHPTTAAPMPQKPPTVSGGSGPQEPQWPANYQGAPQTLSSQGGGGANYSAADLEAFKKKHGIQ